MHRLPDFSSVESTTVEVTPLPAQPWAELCATHTQQGHGNPFGMAPKMTHSRISRSSVSLVTPERDGEQIYALNLCLGEWRVQPAQQMEWLKVVQ